MATALYQGCYARAQELRERLDRMRQWLDENGGDDDDEDLRWRRDRFEAAQREYQEALQIMRAYGKPPTGAAARRAQGQLGEAELGGEAG